MVFVRLTRHSAAQARKQKNRKALKNTASKPYTPHIVDHSIGIFLRNISECWWRRTYTYVHTCTRAHLHTHTHTHVHTYTHTHTHTCTLTHTHALTHTHTLTHLHTHTHTRTNTHTHTHTHNAAACNKLLIFHSAEFYCRQSEKYLVFKLSITWYNTCYIWCHVIFRELFDKICATTPILLSKR